MSDISLSDLQRLGREAHAKTGDLNDMASVIESYLELLEVIRAQGFSSGLAGTDRTCPYTDGTLAAVVWFTAYMAGMEQAAQQSADTRPNKKSGPRPG